MTDLHHHTAGPTVIEERDSSMAGVLVALLIAALIGFFVWLIAFSGVVIDRDGGTNDGGGTTRIEQNVDNPPPADTSGNTGNENPAPGNT